MLGGEAWLIERHAHRAQPLVVGILPLPLGLPPRFLGQISF